MITCITSIRFNRSDIHVLDIGTKELGFSQVVWTLGVGTKWSQTRRLYHCVKHMYNFLATPLSTQKSTRTPTGQFPNIITPSPTLTSRRSLSLKSQHRHHRRGARDERRRMHISKLPPYEKTFGNHDENEWSFLQMAGAWVSHSIQVLQIGYMYYKKVTCITMYYK